MTVKHAVSHAPVLAYPVYKRPFYIEVDGSKLGVGAVLSQKDENGKLHPIIYKSKSLLDRESRYGATEYFKIKITRHKLLKILQAF